MADSKYQRYRVGRALMADGSGWDVPVLSFTYASTASAVGRVLRPLLVDAPDGGIAIGFGAPRHDFLAGDGPGWRPAGELVAADGRRVDDGAEHRYGLIVDGVTLGELGRVGPELYWAPISGGNSLVARPRRGGIDPADLGRYGPDMRWAARQTWRQALKDPPPEQVERWLEQSHDMQGTWDVWDASGRALVSVCPPGGAHYSRWAVLPQPGGGPTAEAALLAAYLVSATA